MHSKNTVKQLTLNIEMLAATINRDSAYGPILDKDEVVNGTNPYELFGEINVAGNIASVPNNPLYNPIHKMQQIIAAKIAFQKIGSNTLNNELYDSTLQKTIDSDKALPVDYVLPDTAKKIAAQILKHADGFDMLLRLKQNPDWCRNGPGQVNERQNAIYRYNSLKNFIPIVLNRGKKLLALTPADVVPSFKMSGVVAVKSGDKVYCDVDHNLGDDTCYTGLNQNADVCVDYDCTYEYSWLEKSYTEDEICVPKTRTKLRSISIQPTALLRLQFGIDKQIRQLLEAWQGGKSFPLRNQKLQQDMCITASRIYGSATIDFSNASNSVSKYMVKNLLSECPRLYRLLEQLLPIYTRFKFSDGRIETVKMRRFSAMGNGLCFSVESLVFYSVIAGILVDTCGKDKGEVIRNLSVYGDDVLIADGLTLETYNILIGKLSEFGLKVNTDKSYFGGIEKAGGFRESCGVYAAYGYSMFYSSLKLPLNSTAQGLTLRREDLFNIAVVAFRVRYVLPSLSQSLWNRIRQIVMIPRMPMEYSDVLNIEDTNCIIEFSQHADIASCLKFNRDNNVMKRKSNTLPFTPSTYNEEGKIIRQGMRVIKPNYQGLVICVPRLVSVLDKLDDEVGKSAVASKCAVARFTDTAPSELRNNTYNVDRKIDLERLTKGSATTSVKSNDTRLTSRDVCLHWYFDTVMLEEVWSKLECCNP